MSMPSVEARHAVPDSAIGAERSRQADAGTGRLEFDCVDSRTVLRRALATSPLKILSPRPTPSAAWAYLASFGGGLVGGDAIHVTLDVRSGARAVVTTQSSTKVYRSTRPASHHVIGHVAADALLVVAPDPTVCFAGSTFRQVQSYFVTDGGSLVVLDWMTCGRRARGERWLFDGYASRFELWRGERRALYDATVLTPDDGGVGERMGRFNVWGTLVMVGPLVQRAAADIVVQTRHLPVESLQALIISASPLTADGMLLRVAGESVEDVRSLLRTHLGFLRSLLGDEVWGRKW